jgi:hypothetical protein
MKVPIVRNTLPITTAFVALSLIAGLSAHAHDFETGIRPTAATATDAAFGKSQRGFMLIPQPYTVKSPVFGGAGESVGEDAHHRPERLHENPQWCRYGDSLILLRLAVGSGSPIRSPWSASRV